MISLEAQRLAIHLGLGILRPLGQRMVRAGGSDTMPTLIMGEICHHYANACQCRSCRERQRRPLQARPVVTFPWEGVA